MHMKILSLSTLLLVTSFIAASEQPKKSQDELREALRQVCISTPEHKNFYEHLNILLNLEKKSNFFKQMCLSDDSDNIDCQVLEKYIAFLALINKQSENLKQKMENTPEAIALSNFDKKQIQ